MEVERHFLRVIEKLGILMLQVLLAANLLGLLFIGRDNPDIMPVFLAGMGCAMISTLAAYAAAQLLFDQRFEKPIAPLFWASMAAGAGSAILFSWAVLFASSVA